MFENVPHELKKWAAASVAHTRVSLLMHFDVDSDQRLGGSESARTEHPNQEVVSSRPCVRARSVIHIESGMK